MAKQRSPSLEWLEDCLKKLEREVFPPDYECRLFASDEAVAGVREALSQTAASVTDALRGTTGRKYWGDDKDRPVLAGR